MTLDLKLIRLKQAEPEFINAVVRFQTEFPGDPKTYTYAAVKAGGKWHLTGRLGRIGRTWSDLLDAITRDNATIVTAQLATTLEDLL